MCCVVSVRMETPQRVRLWLYCRTLKGAPNATSALPKAFKHWAVAAEYLDEDGEVEMSELYEAVNADGFVTASNAAFSCKKWKDYPGFERADLQEASFSQASAIVFCKEVTARKERYSATEENCQKFVNDFIGHVTIDGSLQLPVTAEGASTVMGATICASLTSITNMSSANVIKSIVLQAIPSRTAAEVLFKQVMEQASFQGIGKMTILTESPMKEWIKDTGSKIVLSSFGEWNENLMNGCKGAFTPYQLLQIPVEVITKLLLQKGGLDKLAVHGGGKLASFLTSMGVGLMATGPTGLAASIAFWIASEIASYFFRLLLVKLWPEDKIGSSFHSIFGDSQTGDLARAVYQWFATKVKLGLSCGISWMMEYIKGAQHNKKLE